MNPEVLIGMSLALNLAGVALCVIAVQRMKPPALPRLETPEDTDQADDDLNHVLARVASLEVYRAHQTRRLNELEDRQRADA